MDIPQGDKTDSQPQLIVGIVIRLCYILDDATRLNLNTFHSVRFAGVYFTDVNMLKEMPFGSLTRPTCREYRRHYTSI